MSRYTRYQNLIRQLGKNEVKLSDILADPVTINNPLFPIMANSELSYDELVVLRQYAEAIYSGSTKAAEFIRDGGGEKPTTGIDFNDTTAGIKDMSKDEIEEILANLNNNL